LALYEEYERSFLRWCADLGKPLTLLTLTPRNAMEFSEHIRGRRGGKRNGEWAARSAVGVLKVWSSYLTDEDILEADYLSRLRRPKVTIVARQAYQAWEIQSLRQAMSETGTAIRDVAMLAFLVDTGLRVGELVSLNVRDVDLASRRVTVYGKGRLIRVVPFGSSEARDGGGTVRRLRAYLNWRRVNQQLPAADQQRLWMSYDGRPLGTQGVREIFIRSAERAGVSHHEVHACRHTFAVRYLVKHPGDVDGLRYALGHLSADMYRTYTGQAGALLSEIAGRESIADEMFGESTDRRKVPLRALPNPAVSNEGVDPRKRVHEERPGYGVPLAESRMPGRLSNPPKRIDTSEHSAGGRA